MAAKKEPPLEERVSDAAVTFESAATGPAEVIRRAAAIVLGDDPVRDPGNMAVEQEVQSRLYAEAKHHCRLFKMADEKAAEAYADLLAKEAKGLASRLASRELVSGTDYALFLHWVEFSKPEAEERARIATDVTAKRDAMLARVSKGKTPRATPTLTTEEPAVVQDEQCRGITQQGARCRRRRVSGSLHCQHHQLSVEPKLAQPPTHRGLSSP